MTGSGSQSDWSERRAEDLHRLATLGTAAAGASPEALALDLARLSTLTRIAPNAATTVRATAAPALTRHGDTRTVLAPRLAARWRNEIAIARQSRDDEAAISVVAALARTLRDRSARVSGADVPELVGSFSYGPAIGTAERWWLSEMGTKAPDPAVEAAILTEETWTTAPAPVRAEWVEQRRRINPAEARALVETVWETEKAPVRAALLKAFSIGLSLDDQPFLTTASEDRAAAPRKAAIDLLTMMPAGPKAAAARAALIDLLGVSRPQPRGLALFGHRPSNVEPTLALVGIAAGRLPHALSGDVWWGFALNDPMRLADDLGCAPSNLIRLAADTGSELGANSFLLPLAQGFVQFGHGSAFLGCIDTAEGAITAAELCGALLVRDWRRHVERTDKDVTPPWLAGSAMEWIVNILKRRGVAPLYWILLHHRLPDLLPASLMRQAWRCGEIQAWLSVLGGSPRPPIPNPGRYLRSSSESIELRNSGTLWRLIAVTPAGIAVLLWTAISMASSASAAMPAGVTAMSRHRVPELR
ncbi:MAG: DUF5691 domain-containing protein, partial [Pseudomonadota bacterium]